MAVRGIAWSDDSRKVAWVSGAGMAWVDLVSGEVSRNDSDVARVQRSIWWVEDTPGWLWDVTPPCCKLLRRGSFAARVVWHKSDARVPIGFHYLDGGQHTWLPVSSRTLRDVAIFERDGHAGVVHADADGVHRHHNEGDRCYEEYGRFLLECTHTDKADWQADAVACSQDGSVVWGTRNGMTWASNQFPDRRQCWMPGGTDITCSPDGQRAAIVRCGQGGRLPRAYLLDIGESSDVTEWLWSSYIPCVVEWSPDGKWLAVGSENDKLDLYWVVEHPETNGFVDSLDPKVPMTAKAPILADLLESRGDLLEAVVWRRFGDYQRPDFEGRLVATFA